ncbi:MULTISPECIES: hypothetical protein [unclassified Caballeronia]|uniref:hypothetical protein n=1 Tax=unclassified Caballeronia TaxID=2646786 RepID=UPI0028660619|nr:MULTISPECIES: hypothetical protein [unclassified Caballeronia]MDR5737759.1 hypothetical protein [Caballeronia sp. LZ016]MDR5809704.1 hypothetical protein [Caballeronia sp. LZ019]
MTEPLIDIEGKLRLPALRALAGPARMFGREWSPWRSRPLHSNCEFAIAAALLHTDYVDAPSLRDNNAPYRAANTWGVLTEGRIQQKVAPLKQAAGTAATPAAHESPQPAPVPLAASAATSAAAAAAEAAARRYASLGKPVRGAIALACAALIVCLLFGLEQYSAGDEPATVATADAVNGAGAPQPMAVSQWVVSASAAASPRTQASQGEASRAVAIVHTQVEGSATTGSVVQLSESTADETVSQRESRDHPLRATTIHASTSSRISGSASRDARAASSMPSAQAQARGAASKPGKRAHAAVARGARRNTAGGNYAVIANAASKHASGRRAHSQRVAQPAAALNVEALYAILQHNPALDSNAPSSRQNADARAN